MDLAERMFYCAVIDLEIEKCRRRKGGKVMEIVSFLKMWMDVWNEAEEKGLKMPEEAILFRGKETKHDEVMKEIIKFLPRREFSAENGKMAVDSLEKAVSQKI